MIAAILILSLPCAALWTWLRAVPSLSAPQRVAAAIGLGVGFSSLTFFAWRVAADVAGYPIFDVCLWLAVGGAGLYKTGRGFGTTRRWAPPRGGILLGAAVIGIAVLFCLELSSWIRLNPYGWWDAWAIWNLRAKFLILKPDEWRTAFDPAMVWSNIDYPLMLACAVARGWNLGGATSIAVPLLLSVVFTVATLLALVPSLISARGTAVGAMGLALVLVPTFAMQGASQMADVPVAFYTILAVSLLAVPAPRRSNLVVAGAAMGLAAWTKNEGLIIATVLPASYVLVQWRREGFDVARRAALSLAIGLAPGLIALVLFKLAVAPRSELIAGFGKPEALAYWLNGARIRTVVSFMVRSLSRWGGWSLPVGPAWLLLLLLIAPRAARPPREPAMLAAGILLLVQLVVFFAVYVMTPYPLEWHLATSWSRLLGQMWPTLVWYVCMTRPDAASVERSSTLAAPAPVS